MSLISRAMSVAADYWYYAMSGLRSTRYLLFASLFGVSGGCSDPVHDLYECLQTRDASIDDVRAALAQGADVNARVAIAVSPSGAVELLTPLMVASLHGVDASIIDVLLERGADVSATTTPGRTALHYAANSVHVDVVSSLLRAGADVLIADDDGVMPLHLAAHAEPDAVRRGFRLEVMEMLIQSGAEVNATDGRGRTPLHHCLNALGDADAVGLLLRAGADVLLPDIDGATPLHRAVDNCRHVEAIALIVAAGAEVNTTDSQGMTALHRAVHGCTRADAIYILLEAGADVHQQDSLGQTPLHRAVTIGRLSDSNWAWESDKNSLAMPVDAVDALLAFGASVHSTDMNGDTPLHLAVDRWEGLGWGSIEVVSALIAAGADPLVKNSDGSSPLAIACEFSFRGDQGCETKVVLRSLERAASCSCNNLD